MVEVPEGLETQVYYWTGNEVTTDQATDEQIYVEFAKQINIGFDGNDVYVQGLCTDLPEAWVKGTLNGTTATFATGQYFGADERLASWGYIYEHYFMGYGNGIEDVVFNFDAETGVFTTDTWIIDNEYKSSLYYYLIFSDNVWTPFVEQPGKPANPEIVSVNLNGTYPSLQLNIPTVDVDGNNMNVNKLYYRLFGDIEHVIEPIAFTPELYTECGFEDTVYEIPYTLDDDWDIYEGGARVYLNQGAEFLASLNQIGVQTVYYGGMDDPNGIKREPADNESEVVWFFVKDYTDVTGVTDVNAAGQVQSMTYVNAAGLKSDKPFDGLNIVVKKMANGSVMVEKVVK